MALWGRIPRLVWKRQQLYNSKPTHLVNLELDCICKHQFSATSHRHITKQWSVLPMIPNASMPRTIHVTCRISNLPQSEFTPQRPTKSWSSVLASFLARPPLFCLLTLQRLTTNNNQLSPASIHANTIQHSSVLTLLVDLVFPKSFLRRAGDCFVMRIILF